MFDIAFSEILIIAVVALLVIGPEKLPKVARTLGHLAGRMQRYVSSIKADLEREMQVDDLARFQEEAKQTIAGTDAKLRAEAAQIKQDVQDAVDEAAPPK